MDHSHRLYDFCDLGEKICVAAGLEPGNFISQMDALRRSTGAELAASDGFVVALRDAIRVFSKRAVEADKFPYYKTWFPENWFAVKIGGLLVVGVRPARLFEELKKFSPARKFGEPPEWFPKNDREVSGALLRATPTLEAVGVFTSKCEPSRGHTYWEFKLQEAGHDEG